MKIPTFSRQTGTTTAPHDDSPATPAAAGVQRRSDESTVAAPTAARITTVRPEPARTASAPQQAVAPETAATIDRTAAERAAAAAAAERTSAEPTVDRTAADRESTVAPEAEREATPPVVAGPRPRASLLATLALITGVAAALLVLSGPLVGYGIGLAGLALVLSLGGLSATSRRHVAGKSDALLAMILALGAIVVGVLALTGSLSWLGTDAEPASRLREWLDAQFIERFQG